MITIINNNYNSIKAMEDFIVAAFLSKSSIVRNQNGPELSIPFESRKLPIFQQYISRHKLENQIMLNHKNNEYRVLNSITLERLIRDWMIKDKVQNIDPSKVRKGTLFLWISLFGRKTVNGVAIDTNLSMDLQSDVVYYFSNFFESTLYSKWTTFIIKPFHLVLYQSILMQRPVIENIELNYLLSVNEKKEFKNRMAEKEGDLFTNGY